MKNEMAKLTVRIDGYTKLQLDELVTNLDTSYSILLRSIIKDFLTKNEKVLNKIIDKKNNKYANN